MEKLIELLNEYLFTLGRKTIIQSFDDRTLNDYCGTFRGIVEGKTDYPYTAIWGIEVISKKFGFIKWLVENDKIDTRNLPPIKIDYDSPRYIQDDEEILLMLLSISSSPIEDLISYLK